MNNKVVILIGSETDKPTMEAANPYYEYFNIDFELTKLFFRKFRSFLAPGVQVRKSRISRDKKEF